MRLPSGAGLVRSLSWLRHEALRSKPQVRDALQSLRGLVRDHRRLGALASLVAASGIAALVFVCSQGSPSRPVEAKGGSLLAPAVGAAPERVATTRVDRGAIAALVTASGSVVARRSTPLGPAVPGRIVRIFVDFGDEVTKGDPIFLVDPHPYEVALREASAGLSLARAELAEAQHEAGRMRTLAQKRMVSDQEYDRARTRAAVARARVEQAEARTAHTGNDLDRSMVRAPYSGTVVERVAHEGMMATVTPNTTVVVLQETGALEAVLDIPEASLAVVRPGDPVRLHVDGVARPIESAIRIVSDRIDPASRTYEVRAPVRSTDPPIRAGAFVRGEIEPAAKKSVLLLDRAALLTHDGQTYAFRVDDGIAERVPVKLGIVDSERAEILIGLAEGDEVVVGDVVARLAPGAAVLPEGDRSIPRPPDEAAIVPAKGAELCEEPPL